MSWIACVVGLGFWSWLTRRGGNRTKELMPTGIYRSPVYWIANTLAPGLLAISLYLAHIHAAPSAAPILWIAAVAIILALLFLRRALKWRYPI
jgi:hypothetical protein